MKQMLQMKNFTAVLFSWLIVYLLLVSSIVDAEPIITVKENIPYNNSGQTLDIFIPKTKHNTTVLMFIHGGGFDQGDKTDMHNHAKYFAGLGYVTSSINYRLSLNHPYPTAINDATEALNWLKNQASLYQYDPSKIILIGYSVGGTLALNVGLNADNNVAAIIDVAGITSINRLIETGRIPELKEQMHVYLSGADPTIASPISQIHKGTPPTLVLHGKDDGLIPIWQSIEFVDEMRKRNAPVIFDVIYNAGHEVMLSDNLHYPKLLNSMTEFILTIDKTNL